MSKKRLEVVASPSAKLAVAIMAAGKGTRLKSKRPKVLHQVGGRPLLAHVIQAATSLVPPQQIFTIIGHEAQSVAAAVQQTGVDFVMQTEQLGTGHAMQCAREALKGFEHVLVLSGDVPLIRQETLQRLMDFHLAQKASMTILTAEPNDPTGYGRVLRRTSGGAAVSAIVEQKALGKRQLKVREINSGIYAFRTADLYSYIDKLSTKNAHGEYYLTDVAGLLGRARKKVVALKTDDPIEVLGANTLAELVMLDADMRRAKAQALLASGVTIFQPETCVIDGEVEVGADTVIEPFVQLLGSTKIGQECHIRSYSVIKDSTIADGVQVRPGCIFDDATVAAGAIIGPYSHLRPGSDIGEQAHVGNFVETKKTRMGKGSKANHLSYLGDAEIGEKVNVGAGTITCNYDGVHKHLTRIEDGAFIGSDSTLVAPLTVGKGAYVGAGSCITQNVPADSLALGRSQQVVKPEWAKKRRDTSRAAKG
ncbi:MAG TPA: bifunctional UDP-N-acetylglucosamine diphosphorylase/glucosamine-1-phosphate N-acetyltransferase GlmU [Terriglobales bacterium]|nr:bifunctional UDP-N-acetylglucosamine diphosphorylase/glucosamine-1-phosphate N-acetyltransferase GlmU [Terriglobales bacterium]